jgi:hypothetical protein
MYDALHLTILHTLVSYLTTALLHHNAHLVLYMGKKLDILLYEQESNEFNAVLKTVPR